MNITAPHDEEHLLPLPRAFSSALVIAAHPDDSEYSFGGTVGRLAAEGTRVTYVVCTDGSQGGEDPNEPADQLTATRYAEQRAAAAHLGVINVVFLGFLDGHLSANGVLRRSLTAEIRRIRPELVLTHQPLRSLTFPIGASHPDHLAAGEAALSAVYPDARNPRAFPELLTEGLNPHKVDEVWLPGHEHADLFVDVSRYAERKIEAILCHRSQFAGAADPVAELDWVMARMRSNGVSAECAYAESFKRIVTGSHTASNSQSSRVLDVQGRAGGRNK